MRQSGKNKALFDSTMVTIKKNGAQEATSIFLTGADERDMVFKSEKMKRGSTHHKF